MNLRNLALCLVLGGVASCGNDSGAVPGPDAPPADAPETMADASVASDAPPNTLDAPAPLDTPVPPDAAIDAPPPIDGPITPATGRLRFVHAGLPGLTEPDASFDVYVAGVATPVMTSVAFGTVTEVSLPVASTQLEVRAAGAAPTDTPLYTSESFDVADGASITAVGAGQIRGTVDDSKFRVTPLVDRFAAAAPGKARLRVAHDSHSLAGVSVDLGNDSTIEEASLARFAATAEAGFEVTAGADLALAFRTSGNPVQTFLFVIPGAALGDSAEIYAVVAGLTSQRPRSARGPRLVLVKAGAPATSVPLAPTLHVLGAAADLPLAAGTTGKIDAFLGSQKLIDNLAFGVLLPVPLPATPTSHRLTFYVHTSGTTPPTDPALELATLNTGPLDPNEQYLGVVGGLVADLSLHTYKDELPLTIGGTGPGRLRAVHEVLGIPRIDVGWFDLNGTTWRDVTDFANLGSGAASSPAGAQLDGLGTGSFRPGLRPAGDVAAQRRFNTGGTFNLSERWFAVAAGAAAPATGQQPVRFFMVKTAAVNWTVTPVLQVTSLRATRRAR